MYRVIAVGLPRKQRHYSQNYLSCLGTTLHTAKRTAPPIKKEENSFLHLMANSRYCAVGRDIADPWRHW